MSYKIAINEMVTDKLPAGDSRWGQFTNSFVNREVSTIDFCNEIYTGHAYCTWQSGPRSSANFVLGQHIAVDLDTEDQRSSIDTLRNHEMIKLYGGIIHTTPSHTTQAPRARVIFLLDEPITNANGYAAATTFVMSRFDGTDQVCKDPSRFFYGAQRCVLWFDEGMLPLNHLRAYYKRWRASQPKVKQQTRPRIETPEQVRDDLEKVQAALATIDPMAMDYGQWVAILAALHDSLGDSALPLAVQWAQGKDREVERKWKSFGKYSGQRAGLGSIFHLARTH